MGAEAKYQTLTKFFKGYVTLASSFLLALFVTSVFFPVVPSSAVTCNADGTTENKGEICDTAGTSVTVNIENPAYLTITSFAAGSGGISLDYTAASSPNLGNLITASDTVTTTSNTGQTKHLYISTSSTSNNLTNADTDLSDNKTFIAPGGGDTLAGATSLSDNTWGFSLKNSTNFTKVPTLGNELLIQEGTGDFDDATKDYVSTQDIYYGTIATIDLYAGEYSNTIKYTAFTDEPVVTTRYMQDFTIQDCNNLKTSTATEDHRITLIDKRDNKPYKVSKLADGNCWMVQNLALDGDKTLTSSDSNVDNSVILPPSASIGESDDDSIQIWSQHDGYDGNYYNWCAAIAISNCSGITTVATSSICPSRWYLPNVTGERSYGSLFSAYDLSTANVGYSYETDPQQYLTFAAYVKTAELPPIRLSHPGRYHSSYWDLGVDAGYWTNSGFPPLEDETTMAWDLRFGLKELQYVDYGLRSDTKVAGFSVRCVFGD